MLLSRRYEVVRPLGSGAAGGVYLVRDLLRPGIPIALKRIEHASDPAFRVSLAREFAVLSSVSLAGVAPVYDLGVMPSGLSVPEGPFFTRAFVDGKPFDSFLGEHPVEDAAYVVLRLTELVSKVHRLGIVHGDLKPANVIVTVSGEPSLIDFGLSAKVDSAAHLSGSGTPHYMAPELFSGAGPSQASDLYALGATLWCAVAGHAPFADEGRAGLASKLRGARPKSMQWTGLRAHLAEAALLALRADPRERIPSADEFAATLERILRPTGAAVEAVPAFVAPRPRGREALVASLEQAMVEPCVHIVHGSRGMGKSTVLRELKWRLQLASRNVIELKFSAQGVSGLEQIRAQGGQFVAQPVDVEDDAGELLPALLSAEANAVLLIDDVERADLDFAQWLAASRHEASVEMPIVATTSTLDVLARAGLDVGEVHALVPLADEVVTDISRSCLGSVEQSVLLALVDHAAGNPGLLVEALALVAERPFLTGEEVRLLPAGEMGNALFEARFRQLSAPAQRGLGLLVAAHSSATQRLDSECVQAVLGDAWPRARAELVSAQLIQEEAHGLFPSDGALAEWLKNKHTALLAEVAKIALKTSHFSRLALPLRAELAWASGDSVLLRTLALAATSELKARGFGRQALDLANRVLPDIQGEERSALSLTSVELLESLGELDAAIEGAQALLVDANASGETQMRAQLLLGRVHVARGDLERAVEALSTLTPDAATDCFALACRELARVHLRQGQPSLAESAANRGLAGIGTQPLPALPELLALAAMAASMQPGGQERADALFLEAIAKAESLGSDRDRAQVLGYRALAFERAGHLAQAEETYTLCLQAARSAGDTALTATYALNFGNVSFRLGHTDVAVQHFDLASRLARRTGRLSSALLAQNNLAHVHLYLGAYSRAQALAERSVSEAERLGVDIARAHALQILGEIASRNGDAETAQANFDSATGYYERLSRSRELAEVLLDAGENFLSRAGVSDASAASAKLARAREVLDGQGAEDLRHRLKLLLARARAANGDVEGALEDLERLAPLVEGEQELAWQVHSVTAHCHRVLGAEVLARKSLLQAAEQIEREAAQVPRDARDGFRSDPRRRRILDAAVAHAGVAHVVADRSVARPPVAFDSRFERLLEIIKRLARERDVDRLLERITDAAVELSGAERGFVLLTGPDGQWVVHTVRANVEREHDPSVAFSRSIADAVLIDGEPIVTVNARDDRRINEFMSVHKLMLKSVACVPIRSLDAVLGVLYLEHRARAGRFHEDDIDVLLAFADQAAIALEQARLWQENLGRRQELEEKNRELQAAKTEIESLLEAKTEELEEAQRALRRARVDMLVEVERHGMIGRSAPMQRVFALIDRVADSAVPVVVQGETGTGKELVAKALHAGGSRRKGPFVAINCGALPEQLIESELFGYVRGAFTGAERDKKGAFQQAHRGTLFLDEFADIPARMQLDLLRVLQEGKVRPVGADTEQEVQVRVVVASHRPLAEMVQERRLREDLFYRLSVVEVRLPPLRERAEDLPLLCDHLLARIAKSQGGRPKRLSRHAYARITESEFPGNIRQLEHLLTSAAMMCEGNTIGLHDLPVDGRTAASASSEVFVGEGALDTEAAVGDTAENVVDSASPSDLRSFKERERQRILAALEHYNWNRAKTATALGMPRRTFYRRLAEFGIL